MKKSVILEIVYDLFRHIFRFRPSHSLMSWYQGRLYELRLLHIHLRKKKVFFCFFFLYHKVHKTEFKYQTSLRVFSRSGTIDYSELCILKLSPQQMSLRDQYLWLEKLFLTVVFSTKYIVGEKESRHFSERNNKFKTLFTFFLQKVGFCKTTPDLGNRKLYLP